MNPQFHLFVKDAKVTMVTILWIIFSLTLYYYLSIENIEKKVVYVTADYLITNLVSQIRPIVFGLSEETRNSLKFPPSTTPEPTKPPKEKAIFSGSYGTMRLIMLIVGLLLLINLVYNVITKSKAGLVLFLIAMVTAIIITLVELVFVEIITPAFIYVDFNKTMLEIVNIMHATFNCSSVIATDEKCKIACPNTFKTCQATVGIDRYCNEFPDVNVCKEFPNLLKDGNCTNNKVLCNGTNGTNGTE